MVDNIGKENIPTRLEQEKEARVIVLAEIKNAKRGVSITGIVNKTDLNRNRVRTALANLKGSGEITEETVGMARVYYLA